MPLRSAARRGEEDDISAALGTPLHWERYYLKDLSVTVLGRFSKEHVTVSRWYCTLDPQVVVDFEPHPSEGKLYGEAKRAYFADHGVIYVPIYLHDTLTRTQFLDRVKEARSLLAKHGQILADSEALGEVAPAYTAPQVVKFGDILDAEPAQRWIDREALRLVDLRRTAGGRPLSGTARTNVLRALKKDLYQKVFIRLKAGEPIEQITAPEYASVTLV